MVNSVARQAKQTVGDKTLEDAVKGTQADLAQTEEEVKKLDEALEAVHEIQHNRGVNHDRGLNKEQHHNRNQEPEAEPEPSL